MTTGLSIAPSDKTAVNKLREKLKPTGLLTERYDTDFNLLRWIQGLEYDMEKVEAKLRQHLRFRKAWRLDEILKSEDIPESISMQYFPDYHGCYTEIESDNTIFFASYCGRVDTNGLLKSASVVEITLSRTFIYEQMLEAVKKREALTKRQSGIVFIFDMEGLKFDRELVTFVTGPFKVLSHYMTENYVDLFARVVVVNAPSFFFYVWKLLRPLIPDRTAQKVEVLGSDWRQTIRQYISPVVLPERWGGTLKDATPNIPEPLPEHLYWTLADRDNYVLKSPDLKTLSIPPGSAEFLNVQVISSTDWLHFKLLSNAGFAFGVFYSELENDSDLDAMEMVYPQFSQLAGPLYVPVVDEIRCAKPGFYKLWFCNAHSWIFNLKLWVVIKLLRK